jgi:hypothetical protein
MASSFVTSDEHIGEGRKITPNMRRVEELMAIARWLDPGLGTNT